jgi:hypothetical protein
MYESLDNFFTVNTWVVLHPDDQARFFRALNVIVRSPGFSPAKLGDYLDRQHGQDSDTQTIPINSDFRHYQPEHLL